MTESVQYQVHDKRGNYALCTIERDGGPVWCVLRFNADWIGLVEGIEFETEDEARKYFEERTEERCQ